MPSTLVSLLNSLPKGSNRYRLLAILESLIENNQGCFYEEETAFHYHYCLLFVTEVATRIDYEVQDFANSHYRQGTITIICHGKQAVQEAIRQNSRFFISAFTVGKLLYTKDGFWPISNAPLLIPTNAAIKALKHVNHRMPLADGFLFCAAQCLEKGFYGICVFMLHQAVEQTCICLIRIHIAYRSEFHNLQRLLRLCRCFSDQPNNLFLSTLEEEKLFDVLAKSYSAARYKDDFSVSAQDAQFLYNKTLSFLELAKTMCLEKIDLLAQRAAIYAASQHDEQISSEITVSK